MPTLSPAVRFAVVAALALAASPAFAGPRDELLRVAPPDAALVVVVQNAREHVRNVAASPFIEWFPTSALGKQLAAVGNLKHAREFIGPVFHALGTTPEELLNDVVGDAVAFAFTPAPPSDPKGERAVLLVRPKKPETLAKLIDRLNDTQKSNGELKAVVRKEHRGAEYFERQKPGGSDFYCFRGGVFAFSGTEPDILGVIDRDAAAGVKPPELAARLTKLGVADAFAVALINPRSLDAEVKAKVSRAKPDEKPFLDHFQEVWLALDSAAVYLALGTDLEAGLSLRFHPDALPPGAKARLTGPRTRPEVWAAIPENALFAVAGRFKVSELIDTIGSLVPGDGPNPLKAAVEQFLGPVFGKAKLPQVLDALGPNWAVWAEPPPENGGFLPVAVVAVQIDTAGPKGKETARAIVHAVGFGFDAARVAYNAGHADQIESVETEDGGAVITSLANDKVFPPGFRPSFAYKGGYLVVATSPDAIKRFREPKPGPGKSEESPLLRFSGAGTRAYLQKHREPLAKFLSATGHGDEKQLLKQIDQAATVLELLDRVEVVTRGDADGVRIALRAKLAKGLK